MKKLNLATFPTNEDLRDSLIRYMIANDETGMKLAQEIGIAYNTLKTFLNADRELSIRSRLRVFKFLGYDLEK